MANTSLHIKRIQQELKDFQQNPSDTFYAEPLKDDIHIWHFTIKGPSETEFDGGYYHGKIELPFDYPMKPPAIYFLTPSGRYEINTKICLTITDYHPEHWNPGWTIKTMLKALISYFPEKEGTTSVGALEYSVEERKKLALQSRKWVCPSCGPIINLIKEKEEEKTEDPKSAQKKEEEKKEEVEDEATVEAAGLGINNDAEEENLVGEEKEKQESDIRKYRVELDEEEKKDSVYKGSNQYYREERERDVIEVDLRTLETALLQHILYYEAKQSIKYQKNILNVEKTEKEAEKRQERAAGDSGVRENQRDSNLSAFEDVNFGQAQAPDSGLVKEESEDAIEEKQRKEEEKARLKKQITYINILIAVLLVGIVVLFFAL